MRLEFEEKPLPIKLVWDPEQPLNDDEYFEFCMANPDVRFERTAQGEIVIVPPAGGESDYQTLESGGQLRDWAKRDRRGRALGSSTAFILPTGATRSPDSAWVSNARLAVLSKEQRRKFLKVCPEFVIEVMSPTDHLRNAKEKMEEWIEAGVQLGWLIDGDNRTVYVYRAGQANPEVLKDISRITGEGPVAGFELDLTDIWAGL